MKMLAALFLLTGCGVADVYELTVPPMLVMEAVDCGYVGGRGVHSCLDDRASCLGDDWTNLDCMDETCRPNAWLAAAECEQDQGGPNVRLYECRAICSGFMDACTARFWAKGQIGSDECSTEERQCYDETCPGLEPDYRAGGT